MSYLDIKIDEKYLEKLKRAKPPFIVTDLNGVSQHFTAEHYSIEVSKLLKKELPNLSRLFDKRNTFLLKPFDNFLLKRRLYKQFYQITDALTDPIRRITLLKHKKAKVATDEYINNYILRYIMFELFHEPLSRKKIFYPKRKNFEAYRRGEIAAEEHIKNVLIGFGMKKTKAEEIAPKLVKMYSNDMLEIDKRYIKFLKDLENHGHLVGVLTDRLPLAMEAAKRKSGYLENFHLPIVSSHQITSIEKKLIEKPHKIMYETFIKRAQGLFSLVEKEVEPHDFIMVDDRPENLYGSNDPKRRKKGYVGAEGVGMRTILYKGYKKGFRQFLKDIIKIKEFKYLKNKIISLF